MAKIDVAKHRLVPKHEKISDQEKAELFKKYDITLKQLPKILAKDPTIAGQKVKEGDVIKISRNSPTAGTAIFYRRVSNA